MAIGNEWYNLNAQRAYPIADEATSTDDSGNALPQAVLVDCSLAFPNTYGDFAYIGSLTVSEKLVSLTILASHAADSADTVMPLGAVTILKPVRPHQAYAITPLQGGVGGFVVFETTDAAYSGRFSSPSQSLLLPRCAQAYTPLPVKSLGKYGLAAGLTGLVKLSAGTDVAITKEIVNIAGTPREAFVIGLSSTVADRNVLQAYVGPCDVRPESGNCLIPGVTGIGPAVPDCNGNIDIVFVNMSQRQFEHCGPGVAVDTALGLNAVCDQRSPGRFTGRDLCGPAGSSFSPPPPDHSSAAASHGSSVAVPCASLPYCETFDMASRGYFAPVSGNFNFVPQDSPQELCGLLQSLTSSVAVPHVSYGSFTSADCQALSSSIGTQEDIIQHTTHSLSCGAGDISTVHNATAYARNSADSYNMANMINATGAPDERYATVFMAATESLYAYGGVRTFDLAAVGVPDNAVISQVSFDLRIKASTAMTFKVVAIGLADPAGTVYTTALPLLIDSTSPTTYSTGNVLGILPSMSPAALLAWLKVCTFYLFPQRSSDTGPYPAATFSLDSVAMVVTYTSDPCRYIPHTVTSVVRIPIYRNYQECVDVDYVGHHTTWHTHTDTYTHPISWSYIAENSGAKNVAIWDACAFTNSRQKRLITDVMLWSSTAQQNGGVLLNYHTVTPLTNPHKEYYAVLLDKVVGKVRVLRFTGSTLSPVYELTPTRGFTLGHWYRIQVDIVAVTGSQTAIAVNVKGITDASWPVVSFSLAVNDYMPADGLHGLITDRAKASFSFFRVEELP